MKPLSVCIFCDFLWCALLIIASGWLVFIRDESGWYIVLAVWMCTWWSCKRYEPNTRDANGNIIED